MFSVLRKTKVIFKKLFILTYLRTTRTSRSARNSKGYRWILANSLPNLTLPFQLNDSNYLIFTALQIEKNPHKKSALRAEPDILGS